MGWHRQPMVGFDTETTGINVETDRILTASLVHIRPGEPTLATTEWINPGVPIPPGATAIHGITDETIKAKGTDPRGTLDAVAAVVALALDQGRPLVGMNIPYDLTILDRECRRWGVWTVSARMKGEQNIRPVVDALVLDKVLVPRRAGKGARKLDALCRHYRVKLDGAHDSAHDAIAACRVVWRMAALSPELAEMDLQALHDAQAVWKRTQDQEYNQWARTQPGRRADADGFWPIRPYEEGR